MRDLSLVAAWILFALWSGDGAIKVVVAMATLGAVAGMAQHTSPTKNLSWLLAVVGAFFAILGPRISFIGLSDGEYLYLTSYGFFYAYYHMGHCLSTAVFRGWTRFQV